jgi:hypothetical protein
MRTFGSVGPPILKYWLIFCAFCNWAGWILSTFHRLNRWGYTIAFGIGVPLMLIWASITHGPGFKVPQRMKLRRRFTRLCPAIFLIFAVLTFLSGALYPANNYDALAYRAPRVMHWLAAEHWHWIHTAFQRVNTRGCGIEWVSAPIITFTRSDWLLFLATLISFCLLPGLLFGCLTRLGVKLRVAYVWMWLLPLGSCFLLQAGTVCNDLFAATFVLAGVYYALRARLEGRIQDAWMALLATGLATGVKANAIPLLLVCVVILAGCWRLLMSRLVMTLVVGLLALLCSFAPTALLNYKYCGDWTGGAAERLEFRAKQQWVRPLGNIAFLISYHLNPPIDPFAVYWNQHVAPQLGPQRFRKALRENFLDGDSIFRLDELQTDSAGLGLALSGMLALSALAALRMQRVRVRRHGQKVENERFFHWLNFNFMSDPIGRMRALVLVASGIAFLFMMKTSFVSCIGRLLCPYYALLVVPLLLPTGQAIVVRHRMWKVGVIVLAVLSAAPLLLRPERPLIPVRPILAMLHDAGWNGPLLSRVERVFSVYSQRGDAFMPALQELPSDTQVLGLVTYDDPESTLWKPFGARRIIHVCAEDTAQDLRSRGIRYILVGKVRFPLVFTESFEDWLSRMNAEVVKELPLALRAADGPKPWYIVRLR